MSHNDPQNNQEQTKPSSCGVEIFLRGKAYNLICKLPDAKRGLPKKLIGIASLVEKLPEDARLELFGMACRGEFIAEANDLVALRASVSSLLDLANGGLNAQSIVKYGDDPGIKKAALAHQATVIGARGTPRSGIAGSEIRYLKVRALRIPPIQRYLYDDRDDAELTLSIATIGLLESLIASTDYILLSGCRRLKACIEIGMALVPVRLVDVPEDDIDEYILDANLYRIKTNAETLREYGRQLPIEQKKASKRQLAGVPVNSPEGGCIKGDARDLAAKKYGLTGSYASNGYAVVQLIDKLEASGHKNEALSVRMALYKSIKAGIDAAKKGGILRSTSKSTEKEEARSLPEENSVADDAATLAAPVAKDHKKAEEKSRIDEAVTKLSQNGLRTGFDQQEVAAEVGHGVSKAAIKRWFESNIRAWRVHDHGRGIYSCITKGVLLENRKKTEDQLRELQEQLDVIDRGLKEIGGKVWSPV